MTTKCLSLGLLISGLLVPHSDAQKSCPQPEITADSKFEPGQVWSYKTRGGEEHSTITILRIEKTPRLGAIIHIRVDGLHFSNCTGGPAPELMQHVPFARAALEASVTKKIRSLASLPDYSSGYQDWLTHCGGIYTISVSQVIALDDTQFGKSLGCG